MTLVRLTDKIAVNPSDVSSVTLPERGEFVSVTMQTGEVFCIECDFYGTRWEKFNEIVKKLEAGQ